MKDSFFLFFYYPQKIIPFTNHMFEFNGHWNVIQHQNSNFFFWNEFIFSLKLYIICTLLNELYE
jgi:hypothetical protein